MASIARNINGLGPKQSQICDTRFVITKTPVHESIVYGRSASQLFTVDRHLLNCGQQPQGKSRSSLTRNHEAAREFVKMRAWLFMRWRRLKQKYGMRLDIESERLQRPNSALTLRDSALTNKFAVVIRRNHFCSYMRFIILQWFLAQLIRFDYINFWMKSILCITVHAVRQLIFSTLWQVRREAKGFRITWSNPIR